MKITKLGLALALTGVLSLGAAFSLDAQAAESKSKVVVKSLHEGALQGADGKTVIIRHITVPAGFVGPPHFHPGNLFVYVLEGEFKIEIEKKVHTLRVGDLYAEPPGTVMQGRNTSTNVPAKFLFIHVGDTGKPTIVIAK